jgi:hypothetical protein
MARLGAVRPGVPRFVFLGRDFLFYRSQTNGSFNNQPYTSLLSSADVATPIWVIPVAKGGNRIKEESPK